VNGSRPKVVALRPESREHTDESGDGERDGHVRLPDTGALRDPERLELHRHGVGAVSAVEPEAQAERRELLGWQHRRVGAQNVGEDQIGAAAVQVVGRRAQLGADARDRDGQPEVEHERQQGRAQNQHDQRQPVAHRFPGVVALPAYQPAEEFRKVASPYPQREGGKAQVGRRGLLRDVWEAGQAVQPQHRAGQRLQLPQQVERPARERQVERQQHPQADGEGVKRHARAAQRGPGVAHQQRAHEPVKMHHAHLDQRPDGPQLVEAVDQVHARGQREAYPHHLVAQQPGVGRGQLQRHVGDRVIQLLLIHPPPAQEGVHRQHHRREQREEATPTRHRRQPSQQSRAGVQARATLEGRAVYPRIADRQVGGQVLEEERLPLVLGGGEPVGHDDLGRDHLHQIVAAQRRGECDHRVDHDQLAALQREFRRQPAHTVVEHTQHEQDEDCVEEQGNGGGVSLVADHGHLRDPIGVQRQQQAGDRDRAYGQGARLPVTLHRHLARYPRTAHVTVISRSTGSLGPFRLGTPVRHLHRRRVHRPRDPVDTSG